MDLFDYFNLDVLGEEKRQQAQKHIEQIRRILNAPLPEHILPEDFLSKVLEAEEAMAILNAANSEDELRAMSIFLKKCSSPSFCQTDLSDPNSYFNYWLLTARNSAGFGSYAFAGHSLCRSYYLLCSALVFIADGSRLLFHGLFPHKQGFVNSLSNNSNKLLFYKPYPDNLQKIVYSLEHCGAFDNVESPEIVPMEDVADDCCIVCQSLLECSKEDHS